MGHPEAVSAFSCSPLCSGWESKEVRNTISHDASSSQAVGRSPLGWERRLEASKEPAEPFRLFQAFPRQGRESSCVLFTAGAPVPLSLIGDGGEAGPMGATLSRAGTVEERKEKENGWEKKDFPLSSALRMATVSSLRPIGSPSQAQGRGKGRIRGTFCFRESSGTAEGSTVPLAGKEDLWCPGFTGWG